MQKKEGITLLAEDCVQVGHSLVFIARNVNLIFSLNLDNGKIDILGSMPEESIVNNRLGAKIICWKNELIFVPMSAKKIWIYDLSKQIWSGLERKRFYDGNTEEMFDAVLFGDKLFMIGCNYPAIISLDLYTKRLTYIEEPYNKLKEKKIMFKDCYFRADSVQRDNYLYVASCLQNLVLEFDMITCNFNWLEVGNEKNRFSGIAWDGEYFWLAPRYNTPIIKWNGKEEVIEYPLPEEFERETFYFIGVLCVEDKVIFPGMYEPYTVIITNDEVGNMEIVQGRYLFYKMINDDLIVSMNDNGELKVVSFKEKVDNYVCSIKKEKIIEHIKNRKLDIWDRDSNKVIYEKDIFDLGDICHIISKVKKEDIIQRNKSCGSVIWERMQRGV